jgi:formylglycine-generating enzyme required for sulfatase activity
VPNFADNTEHRFNAKANFGNSYMALHPYVRRPGPESDLHVLTPMDYHVSTSPLFQILEKGHHGVKLADEDMRELITWVDLNVPYHATWTEVNSSDFTCEMAERTIEYKRLFSGLENDDIEWMPPLPYDRPEFIKPPMAEARPDPIKLDGWPLQSTVISERETMAIGDQVLEFVEIPTGKFVMGSVDGFQDEFPQSVVEIKNSFLMSTTEVTNALFRKFKADHDSKVIDQQWKDHIYAGYPANKPEMPAVRVTWEDAVAFTEWLSEKTGRNVTLPTEAQWEWAARAGSDQPFYFGDTGFAENANLADKNIGFLAVRGVNPQPVLERQRTPLVDFVPRDESFDDGILVPTGTAQYKPNPWGLYDMHGNVAEWTRSSYRPYPYNDKDGRNSMGSDERKVVRGGSWRDLPKTATASHRLMYEPYQKVYNVGFRVVIELDKVQDSGSLAGVAE